MQEHQEAIWERLPEYCEKLGDDMRRRVDQRLWAKFDASGFGNSIAADALLNRRAVPRDHRRRVVGLAAQNRPTKTAGEVAALAGR